MNKEKLKELYNKYKLENRLFLNTNTIQSLQDKVLTRYKP